MTPMTLSDEMLCAFMDGELSAEQHAEMERLLQTDPGARVRLDRFRLADQLVRDAWALPGESGAELLSPSPSEVARVRWVAAPTPITARWANPIAMALAAGLVGVVVGLGWQGRGQRPDGAVADAVVLGPDLAAALDTLRSGTTRGTARVALSFRRKDGTPCRQFRIEDRSGAAEAIACHGRSGWQLVAWDGVAAATGGYRTAGAAASIDMMADQLDASGTLSSAEEVDLIRDGWRSPR